jgi:hypothetical protein
MNKPEDHDDKKDEELTPMTIMISANRVKDGKEKKMLTIQFLCWWFSSTAITIVTGIYLWGKD